MRLLGLIAALTLVAGVAQALPRYGARVGQDCMLCHEDPSGGGLRSAYATQFLVPMELAAGGEASPDPEITAGVRIGGDLRTLVVEGDDDRSILMLMQSDLYLSAQLGNGTSAYVETTRTGVGAAYGMVRSSGGRSYLRVGRFEPSYGWRFADHRLASRRFLLAPDGAVDPGRLLDDGIEAGVEIGPVDLQGSVQAGSGDLGGSRAGRAALGTTVGAVNVVVGASYLRDERPGGVTDSAGVFGALAGAAWSWLWQLDASGSPDGDGLTVTHEWSMTPRRGWDLKLTYDHHDPDRDHLTGARERWSAGVESLLTPNLGVVVRGVRESVEPGERLAGDDLHRVESVFHVLF